MRFVPSVAVGLSLCVLSISLHGCSKKPSSSPDDGSTTTTTEITATVTTTTTSDGGDLDPHCLEWDGNMCAKCAESFGLVGGRCFYSCSSKMQEIEVVNASSKGMCLDDTTFGTCLDEIPFKWPNTHEGIKSLRLFAAWKSEWQEERRIKAWTHLANFVKSNGVKVLLGTQVTCNETDDDRDWQHVLALMQMIGAEHIMGLAVGNEMELLFMKDYVRSQPGCIHRLWKGGYFWNKTVDRVRDMDLLGDDFKRIPVTSVFGGMILAGDPFFETPDAMVTSYLRNATAEFGVRWTFSLNIYPYFDPGNALDPGSKDQCNATIARCVCLDRPQCLMTAMISVMRQRMKAMTGRTDDLLWIGETGWSHPMSSTLSTPVRDCPAFSSRETFETYYRNFLSWDLEVPGAQGPDHIFYFTMRDSVNFGMEEHFGLIGNCGEKQCKLQQAPNMTVGPNRDDSMVETRSGAKLASHELVV